MIDPFFLIPNSERCLDLRDGDDGARILMRSLEAKVGWRDRRGAKFSLPHDWLSNTVHQIPSDPLRSYGIFVDFDNSPFTTVWWYHCLANNQCVNCFVVIEIVRLK